MWWMRSCGPPPGAGGWCATSAPGETSVNGSSRPWRRAGGVEAVVHAPPRPGELLRSSLDIERAADPAGLAPVDHAGRRRARPPRVPSGSRLAEPAGSAEEVLSRGRTISAAHGRRRSQVAGTPRTMAAGTPRSFPMTSSAARPSRRRRTTRWRRALALPVERALQIDHGGDPGAADGDVGHPRRQGRPKVSERSLPTRPRAVPAGRPGCVGPSGRSPRGVARRCRRPRSRGRPPHWRR